MKLYRPVGFDELRRMYELDMRSFPAPLGDQPSFECSRADAQAMRIARDRKTRTDPFAGYVTEFEVEDDFGATFARDLASEGSHGLTRIPKLDIGELNAHLTGRIRVPAGFFGPQFRGYVPTNFNFANRDALAQFVMLSYLLDYSVMDFVGEIHANNLAVFLHLPYWSSCNLDRTDIPEAKRPRVLSSILENWSTELPELPALHPREY
jgi:hypothetical protein